MLKTIDKLVQDLRTHIGQHPTTELCNLARDGEVGRDGDLGTGACLNHRRSDDRRRIALTFCVATLSLQHSFVVGLIALKERCLALVLRSDRTNLDLYAAAEFLTLDLLKLSARHARGYPLDVGEDGPCPLYGHLHGEFVGQLHRSKSSAVSISAGSPWQATSITRCP